MAMSGQRHDRRARRAAVKVDLDGNWHLPNHWWSRICRCHFDRMLPKYHHLGDDGMVLLAQEILKKIAPSLSDYSRLIHSPSGSPNAYIMSRVQWRVFDEFLASRPPIHSPAGGAEIEVRSTNFMEAPPRSFEFAS